MLGRFFTSCSTYVDLLEGSAIMPKLGLPWLKCASLKKAILSAGSLCYGCLVYEANFPLFSETGQPKGPLPVLKCEPLMIDSVILSKGLFMFLEAENTSGY